MIPFKHRDRGRVAGRAGFTLIELVTVIVILGVLSTVALPVYLDYKIDARKSACKGSLGGMRTAVANYRAWTATDNGGGAAQFPTLAQFTTTGLIMKEGIPPNPYDPDGTSNNVVDATGVAKGTIVGTAKGWCYNPTNGQVWANSSTKTAAENTF